MSRPPEEHESYMRRCLELARRAVQSGDAPFGAVIVRDGKVLGESGNHVFTELDVAAHGEIAAIRNACKAVGSLDLSGATLYTSTEPCYMCSYAIRMARLGTVVIGARAPNTGGVTSPYPILADPKAILWAPAPVIVTDVLRAECDALLSEFGFNFIV